MNVSAEFTNAGGKNVIMAHDISSLYENHRARLRRYAYRHVGSVEDAEDIVQGVFLEFCESNVSCNPKADVQAYLLGIAKHLVVRHIHLKRRAQRIACSEAFRRNRPTTESCSSHLDLEKIETLLERLSPKARESLVLRFGEGMTPKAAAVRLGCSEHAFRQRVYHALRTLRAHVRGDGRGQTL